MHEPWHDFAQALAADDPQPVLARLRRLEGATLEARFEVHRRNRRQALVDAVVARHPVLLQLVGDDFLRALAAEYVRREPPRSAALLDYGATFGDFLASFPPARSVACMPDLARLEAAWQSAYHAAEASALALRTLAGLSAASLLEARFAPHPATRLVSSPHPVATLWHAHQPGRIPAPIERYVGECALVTRPVADVQVLGLPIESRAFVDALLAGRSFEAAADEGGDVDPAALLRTLIDAGTFTRILAC